MQKLLAVSLLGLLAAAAPCFSATAPVKLRIMGGRPVVENVFLNGHGPYRFLIDTGAQTNQVEAGLAKELGLRPSFQVELDTSAGATNVPGGSIENVTLGTAEAAHQEFLFSNLDGVHALSPEIRGILGQQFLTHFDYLLDLRRHELTFGVTSGGLRTSFHLIEGRMAIATNHGNLVLDSGTDTMLLFHEAASPSKSIRASAGLIASVSETRTVELKVGEKIYRPSVVSAQGNAMPEDGLMPASLFHAVYVSNSEGYVILQ